MWLMRKLSVAAAVATAVAVFAFQAPASALFWVWNGPFQTWNVCEQFRLESQGNGLPTQPCVYRDHEVAHWDGWYFKHAPEF
jgi:hypothetical protein